MDRFYIVHPYQNKNLMDVMYGQEKIAEGAEDTKIIEFETIDFVNEIANRLVVTEGIIRDASAWCREQGYNKRLHP